MHEHEFPDESHIARPGEYQTEPPGNGRDSRVMASDIDSQDFGEDDD